MRLRTWLWLLVLLIVLLLIMSRCGRDSCAGVRRAYPLTAVYPGVGDTDDASNFVCK